MKGSLNSLLVLVPLVAILLVSGCAEQDERAALEPDTTAIDTAAAEMDTTAQSIIELLQDEPQFSRLAVAVDSAGLVQTLSGPGPFTMFAPDNAAFNRMTGESLDQLLDPENRDPLRGRILYHVSNGEKLEQDLLAGAAIRTLEGSDLSVSGAGDSLRVGGAAVTETDLRARNGVIHVINEVLDPNATSEGT